MTDQALAPFERRNDEASVFRRSTGGDDDDDEKGLVGMEAGPEESNGLGPPPMEVEGAGRTFEFQSGKIIKSLKEGAHVR